MNDFDIKEFRRALGQFPTGVTVITTVDDEGDPIGVTASSFNSVSMDPPLILWSIEKDAYSARTFKNSKYFTVNVLGKEAIATSNRFAGRGEDKFNGVKYKEGIGACPLLENCAAQLECRNWNVYEGGDHLIIIGEVVNYSYHEPTMPLVFSRGNYAISVQHPESIKRDQTILSNNGFLDDYLPYLLHAAFTYSSSQLYPKLMSECKVTPEEWRIITLLSDKTELTEFDLSQMIMQPESAFKTTLEWMAKKGVIQYSRDDLLSLTASGLLLAKKLVAIAKEHESEIHSVLSEKKLTTLKNNLKIIGRLT